MINIKELSFKFDQHNNQYFFEKIQINFTPNTIHFITGENGIGKSTFFNILQGNIGKKTFVKGTIQLNNTVYSIRDNTVPLALTQQIRLVQQNYNLMIANSFTFLQNLQFANLSTYPTLQQLPPATLFDVIKAANIDINTPVHQLSGGQKQLLAISMMLQKRTTLLLLDEPTATLDTKNTELIMHALVTLTKELQFTALIICHDEKLMQKYSDNNIHVLKKEPKTEIRSFLDNLDRSK